MNNIALAAGISGAVVTFLVSWALVSSTHIHGRHTLDTDSGVQKMHSRPTPRIGGLAIIAGFCVSWFFMHGESRSLWAVIGLTGLPALASGLAEDITKKVGVKWRLLMTIFSGLLFALVSGYVIDRVEVPGADALLAVPLVAVGFTAFAMGGVANSINIIDGFHGLAAGTLLIILLAFALVGLRVGDAAIVNISVTMLFVIIGFFALNFPKGRLFLGDAGAYFSGYVVAVLGVMLPARHPEVSPWVSLLILGYPVTETLFSILRRLRKDGFSPGQPDSDHLHHEVYRSWALALTRNKQTNDAANPITSVFVWALPVLTLLAVELSNLSTAQSLPLLAACVGVYVVFYRVTENSAT